MTALTIYIEAATYMRLKQIEHETGRKVEDLASSVVDDAALMHFRYRKDDPAKLASEDTP